MNLFRFLQAARQRAGRARAAANPARARARRAWPARSRRHPARRTSRHHRASHRIRPGEALGEDGARQLRLDARDRRRDSMRQVHREDAGVRRIERAAKKWNPVFREKAHEIKKSRAAAIHLKSQQALQLIPRRKRERHRDLRGSPRHKDPRRGRCCERSSRRDWRSLRPRSTHAPRPTSRTYRARFDRRASV